MSAVTTTVETQPIHRPGTPRVNHRRRDQVIKWMFMAPAILYVALFFGYPIIQNLIMSFQSYTAETFFTDEAPFIGIDNYVHAFNNPIFGQAMLNTGLFTAGSIMGQFVIGMAIALFFRRKFPLNGLLRSMLLLPWLIPLIVSSAVWQAMLQQEGGIINQFLGIFSIPAVPWLSSPSVALTAVILVNIWIGIPFNVAILYSGLQGIPDELYEAGELDGATGWRAFRHITWPLLRPVVSVVLLLGVVYTLKLLDVILGLTNGGPANATQTMSTLSYQVSFVEFDFGQGAAFANILIAISLVFAAIYLYTNRRSAQ